MNGSFFLLKAEGLKLKAGAVKFTDTVCRGCAFSAKHSGAGVKRSVSCVFYFVVFDYT